MDSGDLIDSSLCGACDICVGKCPAQASNGTSWLAGIRREDFFDVFKCRATAKELAKSRIGVDDTACGVCMAICPLGKSKAD